MVFRSEIGKIYDTLFYCIFHFNQQTVYDNVISRFSDPSFMVSCIQAIEAVAPTLPEILKPIFVYQDQRPAPITTFFTEFIDFENDTIDTFLEKIATNADWLYGKIINSIFPSDQGTNSPIISPQLSPESYIEALSTSSYSDNFKLQISLLFGNFNYSISLLVEQLRIVYSKIEDLHHTHRSKIELEFAQICSDHNVRLYEQLYTINISHVKERVCITISLLNQYITYIASNNGVLKMLLGIKHEEDLNSMFDEQNINLRQLLIAVGNETRFSIIQLLLDREELTASSVAKLLNLPPTTILRHIEILYNSGVIYISKRSGLQIFYRLNYKILISATNIIHNRLGEKTNENTNNNPQTLEMEQTRD